MSQQQPLVSTIIPVYNRPQLLQEAVESVLQQTYRPIEIIIINDGSTDDTAQVIAQLQDTHPQLIRSAEQQNTGPGAARELGRNRARGDFIQYLDSDDLLLPNKFALQVAALTQHSDCDIAYGKTHFARVGETPKPVAYKRTGEGLETLFPATLYSRWWSTHTPLYRRTLTDQIGSWQNLWNEEDWEYDARAARFGVKLYYCDAFCSITRSHQPENHLSSQGTTDLKKLRDRAKAHTLILQHAQAAQITVEQPEMQHFARELFLLARQCGASGLANESKQLFRLAKQASTQQRAKGIDFMLYEQIARLIGWRLSGRIALFLDHLRTKTND